MRCHVVLRRLDGVVTRGRVILQGVSVVTRGSVSCGIKLRCFSGVVLEDRGAGTSSCKLGGGGWCGVAVWFAETLVHQWSIQPSTIQQPTGARRHSLLNSK
jgi:hypothetical protein